MSAPFTPSPPGGFRIITADQRLAERRGIKGVLAGGSGIGKTSQLWTLDAASTLFVNLEAGELAVQGWPGDEVRVRDWDLARDLACWIGGPNPAMRDDQPYGAAHFARVCAAFGAPSALAKYATVFVDSITVASRLCLQWCKGQPQAVSDRSGKPDLRGAYGLLGQEMIAWVTHLQHTPDKNVWLVGILDKKLDDFNRPYFSLQIEGTKTGLELPGVVDELITMAELRTEDGRPYRAFVCTTLNPYGYPAK
ncbi:MAG: ATP-binding protein, partial [Sphaerobacter sp.]|nr:ATP-binding protein [Sphaerobacter sp.]